MLAEELIYRSPQPEVVIPDLPLPAYVLERMQRFGSRPALVDSLSGRTITYAEAVAAILEPRRRWSPMASRAAKSWRFSARIRSSFRSHSMPSASPGGR